MKVPSYEKFQALIKMLTLASFVLSPHDSKWLLAESDDGLIVESHGAEPALIEK